MQPSDSAPIRNAACRSGLPRPKPRTSFRSSLCRFMNTTPAAMNSVSFISEWLTMCSTAP